MRGLNGEDPQGVSGQGCSIDRQAAGTGAVFAIALQIKAGTVGCTVELMLRLVVGYLFLLVMAANYGCCVIIAINTMSYNHLLGDNVPSGNLQCSESRFIQIDSKIY